MKNTLLAVKKNGKWGFINESMETVIPFIYKKVIPFSENGLAFVKKENLFEVINTEGETVIPEKFIDASYFSPTDNIALVSVDGKQFGYIDVNGLFVIPPIYDMGSVFIDGLAKVRKSGLYGVLKRSGEYLIKPTYDSLDYDAFQSIIPASIWGLYGFINKNNEKVLPFIYQLAYNFHEGLAAVMEDGVMGYINEAGEYVIPPRFLHAYGFCEGLAIVIDKNCKSGYINKQGELVIPCIYGDSWGFYDKRAVVETKSGYGVINENNEFTVRPAYQWLDPLVSDFNGVQQNGKWGFANREGIIVIPCIFEDASFDHNSTYDDLIQ